MRRLEQAESGPAPASPGEDGLVLDAATCAVTDLMRIAECAPASTRLVIVNACRLRQADVAAITAARGGEVLFSAWAGQDGVRIT